MMDLLKQFNWVDILMIGLAVRIMYVSVKTGFVAELMKTFGVLLAIFIAFHYYIKLAVFIAHYAALPPAVLEVLTFSLIWGAAVFVSKLSRDGLFLLFSIETISSIDRIGGGIIAFLRFFLTAGMFLFVLLLTDSPYVEKMTFSSFSQKYVLSIAPRVYRKMNDGFVAKFFPDQKANPAVFDELGNKAKNQGKN